MSWSLKGSYVETCSCDLMCPCNFSFDHGATYDYCRVTLVFNISEGEIEGTDVSGLKVAAIADTPKVMTEGNWRLGMFVDERATDEQVEKLTAVFGGQKGGPMAGLAPLDRRDARGRACADRSRQRGPPPQRSHRRRDRLRDRGHRPVRHRDRASRCASTACSTRLRSEPHRCRGDAVADQRLRHRVRGEVGAVDLRVLVGRLSA